MAVSRRPALQEQYAPPSPLPVTTLPFLRTKIGGAGRQFRRHAAMATKEGARRTTDIDLSVGFATIEVMKHVSPHRNSKLAVILFATALIILWGNAAMAMTLNSPAFQQNGHIPSKYTCEGEDVSPPLAWEGVPDGAKRNLSFPMPYQSPPFAFGASRTARQPTSSPKIVISKHAVPNPGRFSMLSPSTI